jgi:hypothetical protein
LNDVGGTPRLKVPFALSADELLAYAAPDTRIGGFGPWFGGAVVVALVALPFARRRRAIAAVALGLVVSALITPAVFWARLVPQLWWAPLAVAVGLAIAPGRRRWLATALAVVLAADLALACVPCVGVQVFTSFARARQLSELGDGPVDVDFGPFPANRVLFDGRAHATPTLACAQPAELVGSKARLCLGDRSPQPAPDPFAWLR